ncbi:MAG: DUF423 domain-containing protein [Alphaproteobacteria bacterium]|nr:DUF423 domain-containing protein [Alphaproteobacteria bacterium]
MRSGSPRLTIMAALTGFAGVALGAFGAHGLEGRLSSQGGEWWDTATLYGLTHAASALAIALSGRSGLTRLGGWLFLVGSVIFAGTLYAMALGAPSILGAVTPAGGLALLAGWALCAIAAIREHNSRS